MFNLINRGELPAGPVESEFENLNSRLKNLWLVQHNEDGTHNIPASSIPQLDASKIISGTFPASRLPATVAYTNSSNTFTLDQKLYKVRPTLNFQDSGSSTQTGRVQIVTGSEMAMSMNMAYTGSYNLDNTSKSGWMVRCVTTDDGDFFDILRASAGANPRTPSKVFQVDSTGAMYERGRSVSAGTWTTIPYNASYFTASVGTWGVDAGDDTYLGYSLVGTSLTMAFYLVSTSVSSTPSQLKLALPGGMVSAQNIVAPCARISDNGATSVLGTCQVTAGGTNINFYNSITATTNWAVSTNATNIQGTFTFPIQ